MPSQARLTFQRHLLKDVDRLLAAHVDTQVGKGRPLSVYTRSGVFLLSAAWEMYVEEVTREAVECLLSWAQHPTDLPLEIQDNIASAVRARAALVALSLAGTGWKDFLRGIVFERTLALHTPDVPKVATLFRDCIGIQVLPLLGPETQKIDKFVKKRGDIAHQGVKAGHVSLKDLEADYEYICSMVTNIDNFLIAPLKQMIGYQPWNKRL